MPRLGVPPTPTWGLCPPLPCQRGGIRDRGPIAGSRLSAPWSGLPRPATPEGRGGLPCAQRLCPQAPATPHPACWSPEPHLPARALCFRAVSSEKEALLLVHTVRPPPSVSAGSGGGPDIDNEILGTLALGEKTPRRGLSLPGDHGAGWGPPGARLPAALGVWLRGRCPDLLPGRASGLRTTPCAAPAVPAGW